LLLRKDKNNAGEDIMGAHRESMDGKSFNASDDFLFDAVRVRSWRCTRE